MTSDNNRARNYYGIGKKNFDIRIEQIQFDDNSKFQICAIKTVCLCHNSNP